MSLAPDPAASPAPLDPVAYRKRRLSGVSLWATAAFGLLCLLSGVALATWLPDFGAPRASAPAPAEAAPPQPLVAPAAPVASPEAGAPQPASNDSETLGRLEQRLDAVEAGEARIARLAGAALAAAALMETSQSSRPFVQELAALETAAPGSPDLAALRPLAETGAPSRAALTASFPDYAARAAAASRAPAEGAGLMARLGYALSRVITLRRVGDVAGGGVDAVLARAEQKAQDGDLAQAVALLDTLPPSARDAVAPWRNRAERRALVDRHVAAVRARALAELEQLSRSAP